MIKKVKVIGIAVLSAMGSGAFIELRGANATEQLWGYELDRTDSGEQVYYLDYRSPTERIEVTVVSDINGEFAEQMISEKVFLFGSLFEKQRVGYRGQHTEYIECKPEFKPVYSEAGITGGHLKYFKGFASDRFVFGACDAESAAYSAVNAYVYCNEDNVMYDISYFSLTQSEEDTLEFVDKIQCP